MYTTACVHLCGVSDVIKHQRVLVLHGAAVLCQGQGSGGVTAAVRLTRKMTSGRSELAFQDKDLLAKPSQTLAGPLLFTGVP